MSTDRLTSQIRRGETDAVATTLAMGPAALPTLLSLAADPDPDARLGAIRCLDALGGQEAQSAAIVALTDPDPQVATRAAALLSRHPPAGRGGELFAAFSSVRDAEVRPHIALAAGRIEGIEPAPWVAAMRPPQPGNVVDALLVATARMGHAPSREGFLARLPSIAPDEAQAWAGHARYMEDPWVVPGLRPLLSRTEPVFSLAADTRPVQVRICDLAAGAVLEATRAKVPFQTGVRRYSGEELDQVRTIAQAG